MSREGEVRAWLAREVAGVATCPLPRIDDASTLGALGVDAIGEHRIAISAEDAFGIAIGEAEMNALRTFGDVARLIERKRGEVAA